MSTHEDQLVCEDIVSEEAEFVGVKYLSLIPTNGLAQQLCRSIVEISGVVWWKATGRIDQS